MGPKKAGTEPPQPQPPAPEHLVDEEEEKPAEPDIQTRCFREGSQAYNGDCKAGYGQSKGLRLRHGVGQQVHSAITPASFGSSSALVYETVILGIYEGSWEEDAMCGQGTYKWSDGSAYEGSFADGQMDGQGTFTWPSGTTYRGSWQSGSMHGQGRLDSRSDGRFLQGRFHRNCFQSKDKDWINVVEQLRREELMQMKEGDSSNLHVVRCVYQEAYVDHPRGHVVEEESLTLVEAITAIQRQGSVPLLVAEDSLGRSALGCLSTAGLLPHGETQCARVRVAAIAKRRRGDHHRFFYKAIKHSLETGTFFVIVFEDDSSSVGLDQEEDAHQGHWFTREPQHGDLGGMLPSDWRLAHFFRPSVFPPEVFSPILFNGRGLSRHFVAEDSAGSAGGLRPATGLPESNNGVASQSAMAVAASAAAKMPEGRLGLTGHTFELNGVQPQAAGLQVVHCLRPAIATKAHLPGGLGDAEVREHIIRKFHEHVPLHQTVVVLITKRGD